jgi:hypothetical protein
MVEARIVRIHNSLYVNIPAEEARRLGLHEGQLVAIDPKPVLTVRDLVGALRGRIEFEPIPDSELYPDEAE